MLLIKTKQKKIKRNQLRDVTTQMHTGEQLFLVPSVNKHGRPVLTSAGLASFPSRASHLTSAFSRAAGRGRPEPWRSMELGHMHLPLIPM
jgi:hypothetical protein